MNYRVFIQPPARADIESAYAWLAEQSSDAAAHWYNGLEKAVGSLESWPRRCPLAPENDAFAVEIRQLLYGRRAGRYRILFAIRGREVHILHVRHGARRQLGPGDVP
jgi:plasmid stabilization system protein ParE